MRTVVVSTALPNAASGSGASIVLELLAVSLRARGHDVAICPVVYPEYVTPDGAGWRRHVEYARGLGFEVSPVLSTAWASTGRHPRRLVRPDPVAAFPTLADAPAVAAQVARLAPDAVLVYGFEALAASKAVTAPRFAATSDPPHLALWNRTRGRWLAERRPLGAIREAVGLQSELRGRRKASIELARACNAVGAFGLQHAEWLRRRGVPCRYLRTPIADPGPPPPPPANEVPRLLLVGHLQGTATLDGLRVFESMLPHLEREFGATGFEARIVGGYDGPPALEKLFRHPAVRRLGHVPDVESEFRQADVLLVPVSIRLGVRVRILTGFAHGSCVVSHAANAAGIPELADGENVLLASSAEALASKVIRAVRDRSLAVRLRSGGRSTYEQYFSPAVATAELAEGVEALAS